MRIMSKQPLLCAPLRSSALLCFIAFGTATTVLALPSEEKDLVTNIKALYDPIGKGIAEVVVDGQGIEYCWRSHFGFAGEASEHADSDGDGTTDLEEARNWTNPFGPDPSQAGKTPDDRRQAALDSYAATPILVDGNIATPAEVADYQEKESSKLAEQLFAQGVAAERRVQAWSKRRNQGQDHTVGTIPGMRVIDAEGNRPIGWVDHGGISNQLVYIPSLWPDGTVNANVTGSGKICGQWESHVARPDHLEFILGGSSRVFTPSSQIQFDLTKAYQHNHATFVAGIIAAKGTPGNWSALDYFKGAAPDCQIHSYDNVNTFGEVAVLPTSVIKDMRVSNHSYGRPNGWGTPIVIGNVATATWYGNLQNVPQNPPSSIAEDYKFGWYNVDSATADDLARAKPYHLMVKSAGNDKNAGPIGSLLEVFDYSAFPPVIMSSESEHWCLTYHGIDQVVAEITGTGKYFRLLNSGVITDFPNRRIEINQDGVTTMGIIQNASIPTNGTSVDPGVPTERSSLGFDSLAEGFTVAKNTLLVGSVCTNKSAASMFSSAGPTDDGRIKPDVVALGEGLEVDPAVQNGSATNLKGLGAMNNDDHLQFASGTSFAAPAVSGVVTLLSQYQENLRGNKEPLRSCTFKALLCHTADDVSPWGPDYETGWGVVNAAAAAEMIQTNGDRQKITEVYLTNGQFATARVRPIGGQPIKVTISWNDPAGPAQLAKIDPPGTGIELNPAGVPTNYKILKHDLNLTVTRVPTSPAEIHYPFKPDPTQPLTPLEQTDPAYPEIPAGHGVNNRDTVEQVIIHSPITGQDYEIKIAQQAGTTISSEWVSVIMSGVQPSPIFPPITNPAAIQYISFDFYGGCCATFRSVMGGYYKMQYIPYMAPPDSWTDVPMLGIIYSRGDNCSVQAYNFTPGWAVPVRFIPVSPNPFNLSP